MLGELPVRQADIVRPVNRKLTKNTKDTKKSMMVGCTPTNHLLFFVSFVLLRVLRVNWPQEPKACTGVPSRAPLRM